MFPINVGWMKWQRIHQNIIGLVEPLRLFHPTVCFFMHLSAFHRVTAMGKSEMVSGFVVVGVC